MRRNTDQISEWDYVLPSAVPIWCLIIENKKYDCKISLLSYKSTALRPFDDPRYDRKPTCVCLSCLTEA